MSYLGIFACIATGINVFSFLTTLLTPILLLARFIGIKYYVIRNDKDKVSAVTKVLKNTTLNSITMFQCGNFYPSGVFMNWECIGYYTYSDSFDDVSCEINIVTTSKYFSKLFETKNTRVSFSNRIDNESSSKKANNKTNNKSNNNIEPLTIYSRSGSYTNIYYSRIYIDIHDLEPQGSQGEIVDNICKAFYKNSRGVFFIHGVSGAGKSTIGLIVANKLKGTFCHTFNPTDPGDTLQILIQRTEPNVDSPTIIVLEEVNTLIRNIHEEKVVKHKDITTCIYNKSTYNTFFDDLFLYKNIIFIMTSNDSKQTIDDLDTCYLRRGRVDKCYSMMETLST